MKAGSAGSSPDGVTNFSAATQPLRFFLGEVGEAVAYLNTIVVGLDAVENGYKKPAGLKISWNPDDQNAAARKARRFAVEATMQKVCGALKEYIATISNFKRLTVVGERWSGKTTSAEKTTDVAEFLLGEDDFLHVGACLTIHWRNRIVHKRSSAKLTAKQENRLRKQKAAIKSNFASLDVDRLLDHFEKGRPTLKDISTLISFSIRFVRELDRKLNHVSKLDLDYLLDRYELTSRVEKIERETSPPKRFDSIVRLLKTEAPGLVVSYQEYYDR
ncbi:hypothetical protein [Ruegeria sp. HKCCA5463]|uniref:hypothetical protein n=1 Tax=Ruegeria sp. HKCCA5463 TaxID=2682994 RepID=UPI00148827A5|nr:hypothetical protein [Ruegeria sp. HKCCA5463]